jgi:hypothetical protein
MALPHIVEEFPIETIKDACPSGYNALLGADIYIYIYISDLQARLKVLSNDSEQLTLSPTMQSHRLRLCLVK